MKRGTPDRGELVVCQITKLHPNSAEAKLLEYDVQGMIHVSEVASRWVRDIREFLKEHQYVVCRVVGSDQHGLSLSVKRVRREDGNRKLNEFKRERKAENMLVQIAKSVKKNKDQAFKEVGFLLQEEFGSLAKAFEHAGKNPDLLKQKGVPAAWLKPIVETAAKKFASKTYRLKGVLLLSSFRPDGMERIKTTLQAAEKKGYELRYVSAPKYQIIGTGKDPKKLRHALQEEGDAIVKAIEKDGGEASFTLKE